MIISAELVEELAQAVHGEYVQTQLQRGQPIDAAASLAPFLVPWRDLDGDLREANRAQARDIAGKLDAIGCDVVPAGEPADPFAFTDAEVELLARREHQRWSRQRTDAGWSYGDARDDARSLHPSLVPWEQLPPAEQDKDRAAVRAIPVVLARVGQVVVRRAGGSVR